MKKQFKLSILLLVFLFNFAIWAENNELSSQDSLRIMTYNIRRKGKENRPEQRWHNRLPLVHKQFKEIGPDIFGLQEATQEQIDDLHKLLPNFLKFGSGRGSSWWGLGLDEHNPIFYNKQKFTLLYHETFLINKYTGFLGWMPWDALQTGWLSRICTMGKFRVNATNQEFYVYNTHFDHYYKKAQCYGAKRLMHHIRHHTHGLPVIVMGDFNSDFVCPLKQIFTNFNHLQELALKTVGPRVTSTGWDNKKQQRIDHILMSNSPLLKILQYCVVDHKGNVFPSDHRPVFADILLGQ